jgi:hypothetical protein
MKTALLLLLAITLVSCSVIDVKPKHSYKQIYHYNLSRAEIDTKLRLMLYNNFIEYRYEKDGYWLTLDNSYFDCEGADTGNIGYVKLDYLPSQDGIFISFKNHKQGSKGLSTVNCATSGKLEKLLRNLDATSK